ncbi:acetyl esterase/lipase [Algoriphagus ratkowskyi]|nr:alpha/beta hydrolase [Algoriphagus ratkowskyi]PZX54595.1 acetyl esterase/lipase [Algoriphagus ratkowskyi]
MFRVFNHFFQKIFLLLLISSYLYSCTSNGDENPTGFLPALDLFDQSYGRERIQVLDVYLPAGRSTDETPLVIYLHGGAWIEGSKEEFTQFRAALSSALPDYAFVAINYSLYNLNNGSNKFPTQQNDVIEAINYIQSKSADWNISDQLILAGASAGGHLALLHSYKHQRIGNIKAVIAFFPPTDLAKLYDFSLITQLGLNGLIGGSPQDEADAYAINSPITYVNSNSPPTIFFHGTSDSVVPISQSELLKNSLIEANVFHSFIKIPNQGHGFTAATYPQLFEQAADFIKIAIN